MNRCEFSSVMSMIASGISERYDTSQIDLMYLLFEDFLNNDANIGFDLDNGLVCRWMNGTAKVSPHIISYYAQAGGDVFLSFDIFFFNAFAKQTQNTRQAQHVGYL